MPAGRQLSSAVLVLGTAVVSCGMTALVAVYLLGTRYKKHIGQLHRIQGPRISGNALELAANTHKAAACSTPEPCLPALPSQQQWQQPEHADMAIFSPVDSRKRPDPYDVRPRSNYLCWDDYFMAIAFLSAERSKDPNKQVGACIVDHANIILSIGYNGFPRGCADRNLPWAKKAVSGSILDTKYPYVVHAEANALLNKNQATVNGARIYVTLFPCNECAKLLIQAGIKEVVYHEAKLNPTGNRPGAMEQAAPVDALEDVQAGQAGRFIGGGRSSSYALLHNSCSHAASTNEEAVAANATGAVQIGGARLTTGQIQDVFSVSATTDIDASYIASQRLLTMAGVKLRQHTLQNSIHLGPGGRARR